MLGLEYFSWVDIFSPTFLGICVLITAAYFRMLGYWRKYFEEATTVPASQQFSFVLGMLFLYIGQGGPLKLLGHLMFSFHMLSMAFSFIIAPPLIIKGMPAWFWKKIAKWQRLKWLIRPLPSVLLFNIIFSVYHLPACHDYIMVHYTLHMFYYLLLFLSASLMWWQVLCPVPEFEQLSDVKKMGYIFLNGVLFTPSCALIIFAKGSLYSTYVDANSWSQAMGFCFSGDPALLLEMFEGPSFFQLFTPKEDQQIGGIAMKTVQEAVYGFILGSVFYRWFAREGQDDEEELYHGTLSNTSRY